MNKVRTALYNIFESDVAYDKKNATWAGVPIVFNSDFDNNSSPNDYIFLRYDVSSNSSAYGDGVVYKRKSDCDIMVISNGVEGNKLLELDSEVERLLGSMPYIKANLGYDDTTKTSQITYAITVEV